MQRNLLIGAILFVTTMTMVALNGCIKESSDDCPPDTIGTEDMAETMIVTAYDISTGEDITISTRVQDGTLFFFDAGRKLMENGYVPVTKDKLGQQKPLPDDVIAKSKAGDKLWISAWGNIEGNFNVWAYPVWADSSTTEFLYLMPNTLYAGYQLCPGEILFGKREIVRGEIVDPELDRIEMAEDGVTPILVHEVPITQLNSLLWIQVEGLPESDADDYYFDIKKQNNGYDYEGNAYSGEALSSIREVGMFTGNDNFVSTQPYNLVPSIDPDGVIDPQSATVLHLFRRSATRAGDVDLTGPVSKVDYGDGDYIGLFSGKTTNVYIKFPVGGDGEIEVRMKVTPWGQIYQWSTWPN